MSKRILVLNANPKDSSLCQALAQHYSDGAKSQFDVQQLQLAQMDFSPDLNMGYQQQQQLEHSLQQFQQQLTWAQHWLIVAPIWWGTVPAKFKGLIDRTFLPGFAFAYQSGSNWPQKLLQGKTAHVMLTMDTPPWYYRYLQGAPALKQLNQLTLGFSGIKTQTTTLFGPVIKASESQKAQWLRQAYQLGSQGR